MENFLYYKIVGYNTYSSIRNDYALSSLVGEFRDSSSRLWTTEISKWSPKMRVEMLRILNLSEQAKINTLIQLYPESTNSYWDDQEVFSRRIKSAILILSIEGNVRTIENLKLALRASKEEVLL